jgi:5-methylcytosine-specific restriction endonuclease McrA
MADRRYRTAAWQRLRRQVLARDHYVCQVQGARCTRYADTAHHILPSSRYPDRFWDPANLQAACRACNFGDGARVKADNRASRLQIAYLERVIEAQQAEIDLLAARLTRRENYSSPEPAPSPPTPRIF